MFRHSPNGQVMSASGTSGVFAYRWNLISSSLEHLYTILAPPRPLPSFSSSSRSNFGAAMVTGYSSGIEWLAISATDEDVDGVKQSGILRLYTPPVKSLQRMVAMDYRLAVNSGTRDGARLSGLILGGYLTGSVQSRILRSYSKKRLRRSLSSPLGSVRKLTYSPPPPPPPFSLSSAETKNTRHALQHQ